MNKLKNTNIDWIGEIPHSWELKRLKDCGLFQTGKDYKHLSEGNIPVYGSSETPFSFVNESICNKKAIAVGRKGTIDKPFIIEGNFWAVDTCLYNTVTSKKWDFNYVFYWTKIIPFKRIGSQTAVPSLTQTQVNNLKIAFPTLVEQKNISIYLDKETKKIDQKIFLLKQKVEQLNNLKQNITYNVTTKGLNDNTLLKNTDIDWVSEIPSHWEIIPFKKCFEERIEKNSGIKTENILSVMKDIGVINYKDKGDVGNKMSEDISNYKLVYPKDLVINKMNVTIGSLGVSKEFGALSVVYMVFKEKKGTSNRYFNYLFKNKKWQRFLRRMATGILEIRESVDSVQFLSQLIIKPPIKEQEEIADYLDKEINKINYQIDLIKEKINLLEKYKQSLIFNLVTGKIKIGN